MTPAAQGVPRAQRTRWVIVLAGGEGTRLRGLTRDRRGVAVPKQYCSLRGGESLLGLALRRARRLVDPERIVVVVAAQHRRWWEIELEALAPSQIVEQPANRGTAAGLLLPLLAVHRRDPSAEVAVLPSDHFFAREQPFREAVELAFGELTVRPERILLLGIEPERLDCELGWILPAARCPSGVARVACFREKPAPALAARLMAAGALVNAFVLVGLSRTFLELFRSRPELLEPFLATFDRGVDATPGSTARLYERLPTLDLSRDLLERACEDLAVVPVPACGWSDLGTPERVLECLRRNPPGRCADSSGRAALELAEAVA